MADAPAAYENLSVYARHVPEPEGSFDPASHDTSNPVTGLFEIGVLIDGAPVPIFVEKASKVFALIERNRVASPVEPPPGETVAPGLAPDDES